MLKLNKTSIASALAAAIAFGTSSANAALTFTLSGPASATVGSTITLSLFASITSTAGDNTLNGIFDVGGSFSSNGADTSGFGFSNAAVGSSFSAIASQSGIATSPDLWGSLNAYSSTSFFYARSDAGGTSGVPTPVSIGASQVLLGTIQYSPSNTGTVQLSFIPRDRPTAPDQVWQEGYTSPTTFVSQDDNTGTVSVSPATISLTVTAGGGSSTWQATVSGSNWSSAGSWTGSVPNSSSSTAVFSTASATTAVNVDSPQIVNQIQFNGSNPGNFTLSGPGSITLAGATAQISVTGGTGTHSITAPIIAASGTNVTVNANGGTVVIGNSTGGGINLSAGGTLSVASGTLQLAQLGSNVYGTGVARQDSHALVVMNGLTVAPGATLDITNRDLLIHNSDMTNYGVDGNGYPEGTFVPLYNKLRNALANAADFGSWDKQGPLVDSTVGYITSSSALNDPNFITTVAIETGAEYEFNTTSNDGSFDGVAAANIKPNDIIIKFTYAGDINLDGVTDNNDLNGSSFLSSFFVPGGLNTNDYALGDLTYEGNVGNDALTAMVNGFFGGYGTPTSNASNLTIDTTTPIPEPASLALLGVGALALIRRRRN